MRNLTITDAPLAGINSDNPADEGWLIEAVTIDQTGDSGIYFKGSNFVIAGSTILDTGTDASIRYPRHAIYAAGPDATIVNNMIAGFSTSGISLRFQNAFVEGNHISGGVKGISFDNQATAPGTTEILYNTISDVSSVGIVIATPASEGFLVTNNTIVGAGNYGIYVQVVSALTIANNIVEATSDTANLLNVRPPTASYSEHHNLWYGGSSSAFYWNGSARTFLDYQRFSGQGASDLTLDPLLDAELVPSSSSPAIDAGATEVDTSLGYLAQCDGHFFHFCGTAPDLGSSEPPPLLLPPPPSPPPSPTGTLNIGEQNILAADDNENGNLLVAQSAVLDQSATIQSLSFYVTNAAGKLRLGVYSDASGTPGEKLAETTEITPTVGWNTAAVISQVLLPAGTYWLAYLPSDNSLGFRKATDTTSSGFHYSFAYGPLPATFSTAPASTGSHWSFYATLDTSDVPPPPSPPPSPTGTLNIGEQNILAADDNENGNLLVAQSAVLDQSATIQSLSFYVTNAAGKLRLGVYSDASGTPGEKLAETTEITPTVGWNTAAVISQVLLPAGTYWLAYLPSDNSLGFRKATDTTSSGFHYSFAYGPLPATFSTAPASTGSHWSFYATLDTSDVPSPPGVGPPPAQE